MTKLTMNSKIVKDAAHKSLIDAEVDYQKFKDQTLADGTRMFAGRLNRMHQNFIANFKMLILAADYSEQIELDLENFKRISKYLETK